MLRFDKAHSEALLLADQIAQEIAKPVIVVRDLFGRNALAFSSPRNSDFLDLDLELRRRCSPFVGASPVIDVDKMLAPELILESRDRRSVPASICPSGLVSVIERSVVGAAWLTPSVAPPSHRITMYGFKGGVGRSTATFALAEHIAREGHVVLVIDLDLESPGVSTMLAPDREELAPDGLVDHLVEFGVGPAKDLELVTKSTVLGDLAGNGEVWVAAAAGSQHAVGTYLDKLNRVYVDLPANDALGRKRLSFGERLQAAVDECERQVAEQSRKPSVVLLDSRSGIHDIAAVAITQLSRLSFLFATDNPQTWQGYSELFERWATRLDGPSRSEVRDRLQMVAPLVPQLDPEGYMRTFADNAQECFASTIYDNVESYEDEDESFNFAPQDPNAPHYPIPIHHSADLVGVVPGVDYRWAKSTAVKFAYEEFTEQAWRLIKEIQDA